MTEVGCKGGRGFITSINMTCTNSVQPPVRSGGQPSQPLRRRVSVMVHVLQAVVTNVTPKSPHMRIWGIRLNNMFSHCGKGARASVVEYPMI